MAQWGAAFGVPFAFEGLFFFTEAVFVTLYIFGWRRLKPWAHFWAGVPIVIAGIGGSISVVAANAWMNAATGFTLNAAGEVVDVDPWSVIFNPCAFNAVGIVGSSARSPMSAPGMPTLVMPVRYGFCPVMNAARPAVQLCSP
jgi:cytochrome bd-type quinol oxidase subunit 1